MVSINPVKTLIGGLIRAYQLLLSPILPGACRFHPTCSDYARQSVFRFGVIGGGWLALKRLCRCHPWAEFGFDPVPEDRTHTPPPSDAPLKGCAHGPSRTH